MTQRFTQSFTEGNNKTLRHSVINSFNSVVKKIHEKSTQFLYGWLKHALTGILNGGDGFSCRLFKKKMEEIAKIITRYTGHAVEILAAIIVGIAVIKTFVTYSKNFQKSKAVTSKEEIRIHFGSSVAVALELLLGADVLATAVAPNWNDIGKLAAIAVLRTALNYFLGKELKEMHKGKTAINN